MAAIRGLSREIPDWGTRGSHRHVQNVNFYYVWHVSAPMWRCAWCSGPLCSAC